MDAKHRRLLLILLLTSSPFAHAQTAGELRDIQAQTLIAKARAELKKATDEGQGKAAEGALAGSGHYATEPTVKEDTTLPVVSGIYGRDGKLYARFLYASGIDYQAVAGNTAPGGYLVKQVSDDKVVLAKHGRTYTLGFSGVRPSVPAEQPQQPASTYGAFMPNPPAGSMVPPSPGSLSMPKTN
ncbi:type IV pilus biogenesis protein PilP [Xanthomonas euvesicatoria]